MLKVTLSSSRNNVRINVEHKNRLARSQEEKRQKKKKIRQKKRRNEACEWKTCNPNKHMNEKHREVTAEQGAWQMVNSGSDTLNRMSLAPFPRSALKVRLNSRGGDVGCGVLVQVLGFGWRTQCSQIDGHFSIFLYFKFMQKYLWSSKILLLYKTLHGFLRTPRISGPWI